MEYVETIRKEVTINVPTKILSIFLFNRKKRFYIHAKYKTILTTYVAISGNEILVAEACIN
jgi:hypothetical protein